MGFRAENNVDKILSKVGSIRELVDLFLRTSRISISF